MKRGELIAAVALLFMVAAASGLVWHLVRSSQQAAAWVDHTYRVLEETNNVRNELTEAQSSERGYLVTGRDTYLPSFESAAARTTASLTTLQMLTIDNPRQQSNLIRLQGLADQRLKRLRQSIDLRRSQGWGAVRALSNGDIGEHLMEEIRTVIATMQAEEQRLLKERTATVNRIENYALAAAGSAMILGFFALGCSAVLLRTAEKQIRQTAARLRGTLEHVPQGVLLVDGAGRAVECNARLVELMEFAEPIVRGVTSCDQLQTNLAARMQEPTPLFVRPPQQLVEFTIGSRQLEASGRKLPNGGAIWTIQDVTQRRAIEQMVVRSQRLEAVEQLVGGIAHDFNNLLTGVLGNLELASRGAGDKAQVLRRVDRAAFAAERGRQLVTQLLSFSRHRMVRGELVDPHALIEGMADVVRATLGPNLEFRLQLDSIHDRVLVDPGQLQIGLFNLIANATEALRDRVGGILTIALSVIQLDDDNAGPEGLTSGRYVRIAVRDTGIGMTEAVRSRAFEPFFTTKDVGQGPGLGLSQTYGLVRQFNGAITLDSTPGIGTTATIYLPVAAPAIAAEQPHAADIFPSPRQAHGRVLVVEDDALVREFAVQTLRNLGYEVLEAPDADAGWKVFETAGPIDLLCIDIIIPGSMDGLQLAERARLRQPGLRFVYMTGYPGKALEGRAPIDLQAPYLAKPFSGHELAASVARAIAEAPA